MPQPPHNIRTFDALLNIVKSLRGPEGCPWDKEQTHQTLTRYCIEEAHELAAAIDQSDDQEILDELGDVLFQVILHCEVAKQRGAFDINDVVENLNKKMIRRHPHVFASTKVNNSKEVIKNWQEIKATEKKHKFKKEKFDIPDGLPALLKSQKIGKKTNEINFDWKSSDDVFKKVREEFLELEEALAKKNLQEQEHELGDLLFSLAQLARHLKLDSEQALRKTNIRFEKRFFHMLKLHNKTLEDLKTLSESQLESLWQQAKNDLQQGQ